MKGIAISLYDKFGDLAVLVDIIRENWDEDYYISVCSNHPDAMSQVTDFELDIDDFHQGAQIRYDDSLPGPRGGNNLSYRIYNSMRAACRPAIENSDVDYMMHIHADAWPLTESGFADIIDEMEQENAAVAFPSQTHSFTDKYPPGSMEDQFIVFNARDARDVDLFSHTTLEFPPTWIHQLIPMICIGAFGWGKLYQYTNGSERKHWDGTTSTEIKNDARPMFFHPKYDQVHIATNDFDGSLGREIQAHYLNKYSLNKGSNIKQFINNHYRPEDDLFADLEAYMTSLDKQLPYNVSVDTFGRDIRVVRQYLEEESRLQSMKLLIQQYENSFMYPAMKGILKSVQRLFNPSNRDNSYNRYPEKCINDIYQDQLDKMDFPNEMHPIFESSFSRGQEDRLDTKDQ